MNDELEKDLEESCVDGLTDILVLFQNLPVAAEKRDGQLVRIACGHTDII
jgi:hypothetical protein